VPHSCMATPMLLTSNRMDEQDLSCTVHGPPAKFGDDTSSVFFCFTLVTHTYTHTYI